MENNELISDIVKFGTPVATFILGFLTSRFTLTKKEKNDFTENSKKNLIEAHEVFVKKIQEFNNKDKPEPDDFFNISQTGNNYFSQIKSVCDLALSNSLEKKSFNNNILKIVKDAADQNLPDFYFTLELIANEFNIVFKRKLDPVDYKSISEVIKKYYGMIEYFKVLDKWENYNKKP